MSEQAPHDQMRDLMQHQVTEALHKAAEQRLAEELNRSLKKRITSAFDSDSAADHIDGFRQDFDAAVTRLVSEETVTAALDAALKAVGTGPELAYKDLPAFVSGYAAQVYARDMRDRFWCPRWFDHPAATVVLNSLWLAFESYRRQPGTGPAAYLTDRFLPLMHWITSDRGPLTGCSPVHGHAYGKTPAPLPCDPSPAGLHTSATSDLKRMPVKPRTPLAELAKTTKDDR